MGLLLHVYIESGPLAMVKRSSNGVPTHPITRIFLTGTSFGGPAYLPLLLGDLPLNVGKRPGERHYADVLASHVV